MKTWDSNFLLRHLLEDDALQLKVVRRELRLAEKRGEQVFLPQLVLAEVAWVLRSLLSKSDILETLLEILRDTRFACEHAPEVSEAISATRKGGDFPDHLIAASARRSGAAPMQTFDRALSGSRYFEFYESGKVG